MVNNYQMKDPKVKLELRIDWSEIDLLGHVNNLAILKYIQAARVNYLEVIGLMQLQPGLKFGPILASTACQFRKPLFYPGQVVVYSKIESIKKTSFIVEHEIRDSQDEISAEVRDVIVYYDFRKNSKLVIPDDFKDKMLAAGNMVSLKG